MSYVPQVAHESPGTQRGQPDARTLHRQLAGGAGFDELILDPETFAVMGQQATLGPAAGAKAGQIVGGVAILKSVLVSGPGIRP